MMYHIIGLGNPGKKYERTRHNIGRDVVIAYAKDGGVESWLSDRSSNALHAQTNSTELWLPETFMNRSGETARFLVDKRSANPRELVVVHDDVDLPLGEFKISVDRGHGGHNGVRSIEESIKSREFIRVRIGVAETSFWTGRVKRPGGGDRMSKFVLGAFSKSEQAKINSLQPRIFEALDLLVSDGPVATMNKFN